MANGEGYKNIQVKISGSEKGVTLEQIKGWICIRAMSGKNRYLDIWDNREASKKAFNTYCDVCEELNRAKRNDDERETANLRKKRDQLLENFWVVFQSPAELAVKEKTIRGGEDTMQYLALYDTDKEPDSFLRLYQTQGRFTKDPLYSSIRFIKSDKSDKWDTVLHAVLSSDEYPVDIIEKDENGIVRKSVRFGGDEDPMIRLYDIKDNKPSKDAEQPEPVAEVRPEPPVEDPPVDDPQESAPATENKVEEPQNEENPGNLDALEEEDRRILRGGSKRPSKRK